MNCIIVDDEPLALALLEQYLQKVPFLKLAGKCSSAAEALDVLQKERIDLMFVDIQMPDLTGLQLVKSLPNKPLVVFTTAYQQHAIEGFEIDALDYLVKPFPFDRFLKAANKAQEQFLLRRQVASAMASVEEDVLFVKTEYQVVRVNIPEIQFIEGLKDYIKIWNGPKPVLTLQSLRAIEEKLPSHFMRVHKSFIVNLKKIDSVQRNFIVIGQREIPVGNTFREAFMAYIEKRNI
ncbi:MAG: two-component system-response regulator [Bacteroidetes bacterium]|nr:MAG: two-component system-response regulator [Bacteroidota bacterium]